jgi:pyrroloquinoline quinone biosynthesis protein E
LTTLKSLPRPEPASGLGAYFDERKVRLAFDNRTKKNFERYLARPRVEKPDYLPIRLDVENVSRCNFACTMCAVSKWPKGRRGPDMSLEDFQRLIDEQYGLLEIKLNGLGEPLMGRDYFKMIQYARERHIWVRMTTNASLLHLNDNYKNLVESDVNDIDISIDGADKKTFESIRIQSDFDRVVQNCSMLNEYCSGRGVQLTKMWTLVQRGNRKNLLEHVRLARRLGFGHMIFSIQLHGWGDKELAVRNSDEQVEISQEEAKILIAFGASIGVRVAFWDVSEKFESTLDKLCPWPFERAVATSDGRTVPCCMIGNPDQFEIGHGPITETWGSVEYENFRRSHLNGDIPEICRACYKDQA